MKNQHILYLITKSNWGGAQKYTLELAKAAKEAGAEVTIAAGGTGERNTSAGLLIKKAEEAGIECHFVNKLERNMSPGHDLMSFLEIWGLLRKIKPDVLHISSSKAGGLGAVAGRLAGVDKIVFTSHGLTMDESWRPWWQRALITTVTWIVVGLTHKTIVLNELDKNRLSKLPGLKGKVVVIPNGIAPLSFQEKKKARKDLLPDSSPKVVIGGIGELHQNKNWQVLIHLINQLPKEIHLLIIGEGEEREQLQKLADSLGVSKRVHLVGYRPEAGTFLSAFDIFMLPSLKEGMPYVILEAGLAKLPVVASDLPGLRSMIDTGENGILIEPQIKNIAMATEMLLRDEALARKLGENLYRTITSKYSHEQMLERTFSIYSTIKDGLGS